MTIVDITGNFWFDILAGIIMIAVFVGIIGMIVKGVLGMPEMSKLKRNVIIVTVLLFFLNIILTVVLGFPLVLGGVGAFLAGTIAYYQLRRDYYEINEDEPFIQPMQTGDYFKTKGWLKWAIIMNVLMFYVAIAYNGGIVGRAQREATTQILAGYPPIYDSEKAMKIIDERSVTRNTLIALFILTTGATIFLLPHLQVYYVMDAAYEQKEDEEEDNNEGLADSETNEE